MGKCIDNLAWNGQVQPHNALVVVATAGALRASLSSKIQSAVEQCNEGFDRFFTEVENKNYGAPPKWELKNLRKRRCGGRSSTAYREEALTKDMRAYREEVETKQKSWRTFVENMDPRVRAEVLGRMKRFGRESGGMTMRQKIVEGIDGWHYDEIRRGDKPAEGKCVPGLLKLWWNVGNWVSRLE